MNWSQLRTVLWLRWRLTRNQLSRKGGLNAAIAIIGVVFGICLAIAAGVGGILGGALGLADQPPKVLLLVWDGIVGIFLFLWMIGVLTEIQRSETIDLARLLHLPVSLEGIFVINYIASLFTPSIILFVPGAVGLCLGLLWGKGGIMLFLLPLVLAFIFMVTAWTYCLRGWLVALMVNPRRRRTVIMVLTFSVILLGQAPNLYFNVYLRHHNGGSHKPAINLSSKNDPLGGIPDQWIVAHDYVPLLWLPNGAMALAENNLLPAVLGSLGAFLLGVAGLAVAYRSTLKFYTGREKAKAVPARPSGPAHAPGLIPKNFIEKRLPFVSEDVAALALAFFRSLSRAPEIKITVFTNILVIIVIFGVMLSNTLKGKTGVFQSFGATGAVAFTFLGLLQAMFNQFGYDRDGFRSLVLSPARRRDVLLAKNLSFAPIVMGLGLTLLVVMAVLMHLPLLTVFAAGLKLAAMFLLISIAANFVSVFAPYRVIAGSLKPTKPPAKMILLIFVTQLLYPVVMIPIALPPLLGFASEKLGFWPAPVVDAILSVGLLAVAVIFYKLSLTGAGEFLERREQRILLVVSQEVE
ncbi:MAG: hypothetical protein JWQ04_2631 [Pedosphaera sp.]|nr:hypothetical protein [Pedosphaera sp.]